MKVIIIVLSLISWLITAKKDVNNIIKTIGVDTTNLPVTFYTGGQLTLQTNVITYVQVSQCSEATAYLANILISIIQPFNVDFLNNEPFAVLEVAYCTAFTECMIAVNYVKNGGTITAYNNITIPYNKSQEQLYFRLLSEFDQVDVALHITYVDESYPLFHGTFDTNVFDSDIEGSNFQDVEQLVSHDQVDTVSNFYGNLYFLNFCSANINSDYTITVTVTSSPDTPLAGFDLAICSAALVSEEDCTVTNGNVNGIKAVQLASSSAVVQLQNSLTSLTNGIFIQVYGIGGEETGLNKYVLAVFLTPVQ